MRARVVTRQGGFALVVPAGDVDGVAAEAGLEADGYFWEGVVRTLVARRVPTLEKDFTFDSDEEECVAEASQRGVLDTIMELLQELVDEPVYFARLVRSTQPAEFMD